MRLFLKLCLKLSKIIFFSEMTIFLYKASIPFTCYAKYHSKVNNAEVVSQIVIFLKCLKNIFWKNRFIFLYKMPGPFTWYTNYYFNINNGGVRIFISVTNGWTRHSLTYGPTLFSISSSYWFQWYVTLRGCLNKHRPSAKQ